MKAKPLDRRTSTVIKGALKVIQELTKGEAMPSELAGCDWQEVLNKALELAEKEQLCVKVEQEHPEPVVIKFGGN